MARKFSIYGTDDKAGIGLLNERSRQAASSDRSEIRQIPADQLHENALNHALSMTDLAPLKDSIAEIGLQQPLVVAREGDAASPMYRILSGHRRFRALKELQQEGRISYQLFPCIVKELSQIDLPISDGAKEKYAVATTNIENRTQTFSDRIALLRMMIDVYQELKATRAPETVDGRRAFLTRRLHLSGTQIQDLLYIDQHIIPEVREQLDRNALTLTTALEWAHLDAAQQAERLRDAENPQSAEAGRTGDAETISETETDHAEDSEDGTLTAGDVAELAARLTAVAERTDWAHLSARKRQSMLHAAERLRRNLEQIERAARRSK